MKRKYGIFCMLVQCVVSHTGNNHTKCIVLQYNKMMFWPVTTLVHVSHACGYNPDLLIGTWDTDSKSRASSLLENLTKFDFILTFLTVYNFLSHMDGISKKMQATTNDVIEAFGMVEDVRTTYTKLREQIDTSFGHVFEHAVRMAQAVHVEPSMLRITSLQKNRSNTPAETAQEYYRRNLAIPFVDHIIVHLESRFSCLSKQSASLLGLVPSVMCRKDM